MRYEIRPLPAWTDPATGQRAPSGAFRAGWADTLDLLTREAERLGARLVVVQLDITEGDLRRDGMLRAAAKVGHPGVVVSFTSDFGPLRYATDAYDSWKANLRAVALGLVALRAVDRYGITARREQYVGFRALPAPAGPGFVSADEALWWMREQVGDQAGALRPEGLYRLLAKRLHPDVGGDRAAWDRLDQARQLLNLGKAAHG